MTSCHLGDVLGLRKDAAKSQSAVSSWLEGSSSSMWHEEHPTIVAANEPHTHHEADVGFSVQKKAQQRLSAKRLESIQHEGITHSDPYVYERNPFGRNSGYSPVQPFKYKLKLDFKF